MSAYSNNGQLGHLLSELRHRSSRRKTKRLAAMLLCAVMLTLLALSLSGCASPAPMPSEPQVQVSMPAPALSAPTTSYSASAQSDMARWREMLTSAPQTTKP